jgi:hypothetical protein
MYETIARQIREAANDKAKSGMFHFLVLFHADELAGVDAKAFVAKIGVPATYATEFRKMMKVAKIMEDQGVKMTS